MVAGFEVDAYYGVWVETQIDSKNLQADIIVVHFVVTESHINVDSVIVLVFDQKLLIDLCCLFEVTSQVVESGHTELILYRIGEGSVIAHDFVFVSGFLRQLEQKSVPQLRGFSLLCLNLSLLVVAEGIKAASLVRMQVLVIVVPLHQLVVYVHGFLVVSIVESAVCYTHVSLQIVPRGVLLITLKKSQGCNPISLFHERVRIGNLEFSLLRVKESLNKEDEWLDLPCSERSKLAMAFAFF